MIITVISSSIVMIPDLSSSGPMLMGSFGTYHRHGIIPLRWSHSMHVVLILIFTLPLYATDQKIYIYVQKSIVSRFN